ncbi:MAG: hypothetical protein K2Y14_00075 [Burkholderiales bacterium]|nr:hypothetical protein [Burkholderiales bacterium]
MKNKFQQSKFLGLNSVLTVLLLPLAIVACNGSSSSSSNPSYAQISVPTTTYLDGGNQSKFATYTSAGNGSVTLTEIDTGSDFYVIESSFAGPNVVRTGQIISLVYDHGNINRPGELAYTKVNFLTESGTLIIGTNDQVPIVIVPDGEISNVESQNHAIMGMRMNSNLSAKLFLPYPYNQMFMLNIPDKELVFGNFSPSTLSAFGTTQLVESACNNESANTSSQATCWNDMALQVSYTANYKNKKIESTINTLFDSGAQSNFQVNPLPDWLEVNQTGSDIENAEVRNQVRANLPTNLGNLNVPLNLPIGANESQFNGGSMVNAGNNLFNFYTVLFDQVHGQIGLLNNTSNRSVTVPLTYQLQGESMGPHLQVNLANNQMYVGLDTGSIGLRVLESQISDWSEITKHVNKVIDYGYMDGVAISGYLANAPITIGGISTNINFMVITSVTCNPQKPNCPKTEFVANGRGGLIGIRPDNSGASDDNVWSPLPQLPGNYSNGFIIHGKFDAPSLTLGLTAANQTGFEFQSLLPYPQPETNLAPYYLWDVVLPAKISYPLSNGQIKESVGLVLYDTGTAQYTIYNQSPDQAGLVASNLSITQTQRISNGNYFLWSFNTGTTLFLNSAFRSDTSLSILVNTGNIPFTMFDILYDVQNGQMGFKANN